MTADDRRPPMPGRRACLGAGLALGGCGFRPLYAPMATGPGPAAAALAAIYVPIFGERPGQLLRQALQQRFEGRGNGVAKTYELVAAISIVGDGIAVQRDNSTTRVRLTGSAPWTLRTLSLDHAVLTQGTTRTLDGYNIIAQQFFAAELENDAAQRRIVSALADQITIQLGAFFLERAKAAAG